MRDYRSGARRWTRLAMAAAIILASAAATLAAPGDLDPSFGGWKEWKIVTEVGGVDDSAYGVVLQPDGKLVAAGRSYNGGNDDFALVRYNSDGTLDTSFNGTGKVTTPIGISHEEARALVLQSDGKLVAAGYSSYLGISDFALVRYNSDGALDTSFNGTGKVITPIGTSHEAAAALVLQPDGKLVAAGYSSNGSNSDFALVRYNSDGTLDTSFNGTGKVTTPIGTIDDEAHALVLQSDGKLVAAGYSYDGNYKFALVRYNSDGTLDTSFNGTGKVTTPIGTSGEAHALVLQPDGKLVAAGYSIVGSTDFALVRYNSDGTPDTSFNGTGKVTTPIGTYYEYAHALVLQADGKVVAAGLSDNGGSNYYFALVRYNPDGTVETGYRPGIIDTAGIFSSGLAQQVDGALLLAGGSAVDDQAKVARYLDDGHLDTSFGSGGIASVDFGGALQSFGAVLQQSDEQIVAAGSVDSDFAIARFFDNGLPDGTFGTGGKVTTDLSGVDNATFILQQSDGKLVVGGRANGGDDFGLARYTASGALDLSFNGSGKVISDFGGADYDLADSGVLQPDGKILVAGTTGTFSDADILVARYNSNGSLDSGFGTGGTVTVSVLLDQEDADLVVQPDGRILVCSTGYDALSVPYATLARLNADGSLDSTFGSGGVAVGPQGYFRHLVRESTGRIIVTGDTDEFPTLAYKVARFTAAGTLDPTFGSGGVVVVPVDGELFGDLILQSDGKPVLVGDDIFLGATLVRLQSSYCHSPDPAGTCGVPGKGQLLLKRNSDPAKDKLIFKWLNGTAEPEDLDDPTTSSDYSLCVYDDDGQALKMSVPAGGTCDTAPCWTSSSVGYQYKDKSLPPTNAGIAKIKLKSGGSKAKAIIKARGDSLPDDGNPFSGNVTALVVNEETGVCFASSFSGSQITQNDGDGFKGKTP